MPSEKYTFSENSSLMLDLLRALASQAVVVGHGISYFAIWPSLQPPTLPYLQNIAVVVFFVLSGFLITYATLRKPAGFRFREFFIERFARIYSAYVVVLVLVWVIDRIAIHLDRAKYAYRASLNWKTFVGNVLMLQDHPIGEVHHFAVTSFGSARPFWTLAIEWWIYMCFGWIVLRNRSKPFWLYVPVLAVLAVVPAYNMISGRGNGLALIWMFGSVIFLLASSVRRLVEARTATLVGATLGFGVLGLVLLHNTKEPYDVRFGALLAATILCAVLAVDRVPWKTPPLVGKAIRFIANYSFTLYLLHYTVLDVMANHRVVDDPTLNFLIAFAVANALSILVAYFTEFRHRAFAGWLKRKLI